MMKRSFPIVVLGVAFLAACGGDDSKSDASTTGTRGEDASNASASKRGAVIKVMSSRYGEMLFDGKGRALYLFTRDRRSRSRCYGECASAWPPFLTGGAPRAGEGAHSTLLRMTRRRDGKKQVTYRGNPLYYFEGDREPGEILCQDVAEFGGTWLVVSPDGKPVR